MAEEGNKEVPVAAQEGAQEEQKETKLYEDPVTGEMVSKT